MNSRSVRALLVALLTAAVLSALSAAAQADTSQTPVVTGCPAGYEHVTVVALEAAGPYPRARVVDTAPWTPPSALRLLLPSTARGAVAPNEAASAELPAAGLDPGAYQVVVRVFETGRPGTAVVRTSDPLVVVAPPPDE